MLLLVNVMVLVVFIRLSLGLLPFAVLRKMLDHVKSLRWKWHSHSSPENAIRMVKAAAQYVPGATCLTQALAVETLYALRGEAARICFGVSHNGAGHDALEAHAWVESGGKIVIGAPETGKFTPLVRYR